MERKKGLAGVALAVLFGSTLLQVATGGGGREAFLELRVSSWADLRNAIRAKSSERRIVLRVEPVSTAIPPAGNESSSRDYESSPSASMLSDDTIMISSTQSVVILGDGQTTISVADSARCPYGHDRDLFVNEGHLHLDGLGFTVGANGRGDGGCDGARVVKNWGSLEITDCDFDLSGRVAQQQGRVVRDRR